MSIELIDKDGYDIEIERNGNRIDILLVENEAFDGRIVIKADEREDFLIPWVQRLIEHKEKTGPKGTKQLAKLLNRSVLFEKNKNKAEFISVESLNTEIIKLRKALLNEREKTRQRRKWQ